MSPIMLALFPLSPKAVAATLLVLAAALAAFLFANPGGPSGSHESPGATPEPAASGPGEDDGGKPGPATFIIEPHFDPADPRQMAAASENVFIGEVLSESGVEVERSTIPNDPGLPVTHFEVRVVRPLASSGAHPVDQRDAAVSVTQLGGTHPGTQEEVLAEGHAHESPGHHDHDHAHEHDGHSHDDGNGHDGHAHQIDRMLQAGQRYAFATTYNERYGSHQLVTQPGGARLLDNASEEEAIALLYSRLPVGPRAAETPEDVQAPEGHDHHHGHERGHDHEHEETP